MVTILRPVFFFYFSIDQWFSPFKFSRLPGSKKKIASKFKWKEPLVSCYGDIRNMCITSLCAVDQLLLVPVSFACFSFALPSEFSKAQFSFFYFNFSAGLVCALFSIVYAGHLNEVPSEKAALTTIHMLPWSSNPLYFRRATWRRSWKRQLVVC